MNMEEILRYLEEVIVQRERALGLAEEVSHENTKLKAEVEQLQGFLNPKPEKRTGKQIRTDQTAVKAGVCKW